MFNKAVVIVGPTASGKTELSLSIAENLFEIISVDSAQVYKYMDIGTGKVSQYYRSLITHYCIDIVEPDFWFTAGDFCKEAEKAVNEIFNKKKIPLFVGGTGLYIHAFFFGLARLPKVGNAIKQQLHQELTLKGREALYNELLKCDPQWASRVHPHDTQRILRGLEVYRSTGKPISHYLSLPHDKSSLNTLMIGLNVDRDVLYKRIEKRVNRMIEQGFVEEVAQLRKMGFTEKFNSQKSIGYLQIHKYFLKELSFEEAVEQIKKETKQYAKRQLTWFKRYQIHWFAPNEIEKIKEFINRWLGI